MQRKPPATGTILVDDITEVWEGEQVYDDVELAYHHGQIAAALDKLTSKQREYVQLRFWHDYDYDQLFEHFGYNPGMLWHRSRTKLREQLQNLELVQ